jgi:hypothetical protein
MTTDNRTYTSRRMSIVYALVEKLKAINGQFPHQSDLEGRVEPRLKFWDEIQEFPAVHLNAGSETRVYQGGGFKERHMSLNIRCYVQEENANVALEGLLEDIETVLEDIGYMAYFDRQGKPQAIQRITILGIDTDEGVLEPTGVGDIICEVQY